MPDYIAWCHNHTVEKRFKKQKGISREYMQEKQKFLIELQWYLFKLDTISIWRTPYRDSTWKWIFSKNLMKNWCLLWFFKLKLSVRWRKDIKWKANVPFHLKKDTMWLLKLSVIWFYWFMFFTSQLEIIKLIPINLSKNLQALSYYSKVCIKWLENV